MKSLGEIILIILAVVFIFCFGWGFGVDIHTRGMVRVDPRASLTVDTLGREARFRDLQTEVRVLRWECEKSK